MTLPLSLSDMGAIVVILGLIFVTVVYHISNKKHDANHAEGGK